jgi:hypothetical protein
MTPRNEATVRTCLICLLVGFVLAVGVAFEIAAGVR